MIRWLHISDLHFNDDDMSTIFMRDELPKYLKEKDIKCDYISVPEILGLLMPVLISFRRNQYSI